jgi:nucleoside-diphosphate-sugar epimerase
VVRALVERGAKVVAQVREPGRFTAACAAGAEVRAQDLAVPGSARELVARIRPEVVFNLAGYGVAKGERDATGYRRMNTELVEELASALGERGARTERPGSILVHLGSALEYGTSPALDERAQPRPSDPYGHTKAAATAALARCRTEVASVVARAFTVFGPGERPGRLVPTLLAARAGTGRIPLSAGTQRRDFVYVEDVARANVLAAAADDSGLANIATGVETSVDEIYRHLSEATGFREDPVYEPPRTGDVYRIALDIRRAEEWLGWVPDIALSDGLRRTVEWFRRGRAA